VKRWEDRQSAKVDITRELVRRGAYKSLNQVETCRKMRLTNARQEVEQLEHFFYSDWWYFWTDINPEVFMNRVKKRVENGEKIF
jgi:hypothetical protein